jgi:hypothetical protein
MLVITGKGDRNGYSIRSELMNGINIPEISSYIIYILEAQRRWRFLSDIKTEILN